MIRDLLVQFNSFTYLRFGREVSNTLYITRDIAMFRVGMPIVCRYKSAFEINNPGDIFVKSVACLRKLRERINSRRKSIMQILLSGKMHPREEVLLRSSLKKKKHTERR